MIGFQRATDPLEDLLASLLRLEHVGEDERRFLKDAHERALQARERAAAFRTLLESVLQVNLALETKRLSEVSIRQADQAKKISSWAAILFTPTLVGWHLRHELPQHAGAAMGVRLPDGTRADARDQRHPVDRVPPARLDLARRAA
ncbi:MAG: hypothetical protein PGN13_03875 [Patulibacter minatonensis]